MVSNPTPDYTRNTRNNFFQEGLLNRYALQQYILCATQHPAGGLRDKPPK